MSYTIVRTLQMLRSVLHNEEERRGLVRAIDDRSGTWSQLCACNRSYIKALAGHQVPLASAGQTSRSRVRTELCRLYRRIATKPINSLSESNGRTKHWPSIWVWLVSRQAKYRSILHTALRELRIYWADCALPYCYLLHANHPSHTSHPSHTFPLCIRCQCF